MKKRGATMKRPAAAAEAAMKRPAAAAEAAVTPAAAEAAVAADAVVAVEAAVAAAYAVAGLGDGIAEDSAVEAEDEEEQAKSEILNL